MSVATVANRFRLRGLSLAVSTGLLGLACAAGADTLVLYTNDFEDIVGDRFTADTGHDIEVVQMSGGNLLARIAAESNNPQWDVLMFDGVGSLHNMDQEGLFRRGWEPENFANLTEQARELVPDTLGWMPAGATASCVIAYRTDLVDQAPQTFADLTDRRFRGLIGQADPAVAAPAYPCVASLHHDLGMDGARDLYSNILDNELRVFRTNGPTGRALAAGETHVALLSSPQSYNLQNSDNPVSVVWPEDGAPASSRGVAIQANTQKVDAAEAFINWVLTADTQQFLTDEGGVDGYFLPSVEGVNQRADGPPADSVYRIAPAAWAAEHEADIKSWFADQAVN